MIEYADRSLFRYLRQTRTAPGQYRPIPSAWIVAIQQNDGHNLVYWVDTASYWGDGLSPLYLARHYPRTLLVDPAFRPLRKLGKCSDKAAYWHRHAKERAAWIKRSSQFEIPIVAKWWERLTGPATFGFDVLLQSETKLVRNSSAAFQAARYLRQAIVSPEHPNAIRADYFMDHREVIAYVETDPILQGLHCRDHWNRVFYVDHAKSLDGLSPCDDPGLVDPWSIEPGYPALPAKAGTPYSTMDQSQWEAMRDKYLEKIGV